MTELKRR
jgi:Ca2+-binding EF-hand superfamily protein